MHPEALARQLLVHPEVLGLQLARQEHLVDQRHPGDLEIPADLVVQLLPEVPANLVVPKHLEDLDCP